MKSRLTLTILIVSLALAPAACGSASTPTPALTAVPQVDCTQDETHPIAQSIADEFGISYDQVMAWACGGETFDDILLALETGEITGRSPDELLAMKAEAGGWEQVWDALGLSDEPES